MPQVFPLLQEYWNILKLHKNTVVLVPLCGSSLDLQWLAEQGHYVIGVDVSEIAIKNIIKNHDEPFQKSTNGSLTCYTSNSIELWCGNFLKLRQQWLPSVDAIYDKAALIALPVEKRLEYAQHLHALAQPHTQIFMNCFEYEQSEMPGPPFAVFIEELELLFGDTYHIKCLHTHSLFDELTNFKRRGLHSYLNEKIYQLYPK